MSGLSVAYMLEAQALHLRQLSAESPVSQQTDGKACGKPGKENINIKVNAQGETCKLDHKRANRAQTDTGNRALRKGTKPASAALSLSGGMVIRARTGGNAYYSPHLHQHLVQKILASAKPMY